MGNGILLIIILVIINNVNNTTYKNMVFILFLLLYAVSCNMVGRGNLVLIHSVRQFPRQRVECRNLTPCFIFIPEQKK